MYISWFCSVTVRGDHQDEAVLCTEKATFELKMADTSNSLLLVPRCALPKDEGLGSFKSNVVKEATRNHKAHIIKLIAKKLFYFSLLNWSY